MSEDLKMKFIQELSKGNVSIGQLIMEVHGDNHYYEKDYQPKTGEATTKDAAQESVSSELMVNALKQCGAYKWLSTSNWKQQFLDKLFDNLIITLIGA